MEEILAMVMVPVLTAAIEFAVLRLLDWLMAAQGGVAFASVARGGAASSLQVDELAPR